jgi:ubiquinone/menaquinone biosynthesis C-methylase UbiE
MRDWEGRKVANQEFDKTKEHNYEYWNEAVIPGYGFMVSTNPVDEYALIRRLILGFVDDGESLLDVGCSSGGTYDFLKKKNRNISYQGVDYCEKFIEDNRKRYPEKDWAVEDARNLPYADKSFDVVCLYDVLDSMPGWQQALDEAIRIARKRVIVIMWIETSWRFEYMREKGMSVLQLDLSGNVHLHKFLVGFL